MCRHPQSHRAVAAPHHHQGKTKKCPTISTFAPQ
jgi:hypothetical protein